MIGLLILFLTNVKIGNFKVLFYSYFLQLSFILLELLQVFGYMQQYADQKVVYGIVFWNYFFCNNLYLYIDKFQLTNNSSSKREDLAYGFLIDASYLEEITALSNTLFYSAIIFIFTSFLYIKTKRQISSGLILLKNYEIQYFCFVVWFIVTNFYENYAYRYPIFYFLFFLVFLEGDRYLKFAILGMISLLPIPVTNEVLQVLIFILHRLCHYYFLIHISSNLFARLISDKNLKHNALSKD